MCLSLLPTAALAAESAGLDNFKKVQTYTNGRFTDVKDDDWFARNVSSAYELNLMIGKGDSVFDTESNMTVAEAMTIAARLRSIYYTGKAEFVQDKGNLWYQVYTDYCKANGIADPADYDLKAPVTRGQFAEIFAKALPEEALEEVNKVSDNAIPDVKTTDKFGVAIYLLYRAGILIGSDAEGTFYSDRPIKRVECAAVTTRMAEPVLRQSITLETDKDEDKDEDEDKDKDKPQIPSGGGIYFPLATTYTVTFDMQGHGTQVAPITNVASDAKITAPNAPTAADYAFKGWYKEAECTNVWDFDTDTVKENTTLYAKWVEMKTVADILGTVVSFPTSADTNSPDNAWLSNLARCFRNGDNLIFASKPSISLLLTTNATKVGDDFVCTNDGISYTFKMTGGKLTAITVSGSAFLDGTYIEPVEYTDWDDTNKEFVKNYSGNFTEVTNSTTALGSGVYVVKKDTTISGTLTVNGTADNPTRLILADGAKLTVNGADEYAGILVASDKVLIITGQSAGTGTLIATGGSGGAGIGGNDGSSGGSAGCGTVTINGGTVTATGQDGGAGIGGGLTGTGGTVAINGGAVTAKGGSGGAGIGGGFKGSGGAVTINGGTVTASGSAAIGAGIDGSSPGTLSFGTGVDYEINAGADKNHTAAKTAAEYAQDHSAKYVGVKSGVKYMDWDDSAKKLVEKITADFIKVTASTTELDAGVYYVVKDTVITGGLTVNGTADNPTWLILADGAQLTANGASGKAGIYVTEDKALIITGQSGGTGILNATGSNAYAGIGGGGGIAGHCGIVTINGGTVTANGGISSAGIGGGAMGIGGTVTINGGTVTAKGGNDGAGIGGGSTGDGSTLTVNGGTVTATGSTRGAGIGGGAMGIGGTVTINGGTVTATGGASQSVISKGSGAGIGGGGGSSGGNGGTVTINGGTVTATGGKGAQAIGRGNNTGAAFGTLTFGEDVDFKVMAGTQADDTTEMTSEAYAQDHSAAYVGVKSVIKYKDWDASAKNFVENFTDNFIEVTETTTELDAGVYYVVKDTVITGGLTVNGTADNPTWLILTDGGQLTANGASNKAGINVASGKALVITGQSAGTGALIATGGNGAAGIGGNMEANGGTVTINGGTVTAKGGQYGAGIGGNMEANGGTLTINGGTVTATGGKDGGAGIGAGYGSSSHGTLTFGEGVDFKVMAGTKADAAIEMTSQAYAQNHSAVYVSIAKAPVKYMDWDDSAKKRVEKTTLDFVKVTETTTTLDAGVYYVVKDTVTTGTLTVSGTADNPTWLILADGAQLTATGATNKAGIDVASGKALIITGQSGGSGTLIAKGNGDGAGIGGSSEDVGGIVTINGGTVTATGGTVAGNEGGAGIGGGYRGDHGDSIVTINGGTITATGGGASAGIGEGYACYDGSVTINGGVITAIGGSEGGQAIGGVAGCTLTFDENVDFKVKAGTKADDAAEMTSEAYAQDHSAAYVNIEKAPVKYMDWDGANKPLVEKTTLDYIKVTETTTKLIAGVYYVVKDTVTTEVFTVLGTADNPTTLILADGAQLTVGDGTFKSGGIAVNSGKALIITCQSGGTGELAATGNAQLGGPGIGGGGNITIIGGTVTATGGYHGAGIGGGENRDGGTVTIYGGEITATGVTGIGGGYNGAGGTITINGGTVIATSNGASAGIGGGSGTGIGGVVNGVGGTITINGGTVTATGESGGAGIGGGTNCAGGTITINGGTVNATGGTSGAGIGGGSEAAGGNITINGGTVTATSGKEGGAGIGGGDAYHTYDWDGLGPGLGGNITINGGTVTATGKNGAGIGGGANCAGGTITINGGDVTATGGNGNYVKKGGAGIGGGIYGAGGTVKITGGTVNATGAGAGIGGGEYGVGGTVTIEKGEVTAISNGQGAGIGSGSFDGGSHKISGGNGGTVTINGGTVTATGGMHGAGIGGGFFADGGTVIINGGMVTATGGINGAGIGGGAGIDDIGGAGGTVTINGGTVTATGSDGGAGIGGGMTGAGGTVTITGGTVTATGGTYDLYDIYGGAGIGGGSGFKKSDGEGGTEMISGGNGGEVTITGGTVTATGGFGAGIGGGSGYEVSDGKGGTLTGNGGNGGTVTINGGYVTATGNEAIGMGKYGTESGTVDFDEDVEFTVNAGADENNTDSKTTAAYTEDHSAAYVSIAEVVATN